MIWVSVYRVFFITVLLCFIVCRRTLIVSGMILREGYTVKVFPPSGFNQSLDEGMRYRSIREGLDFPDFENPQVGLPSVILE